MSKEGSNPVTRSCIAGLLSWVLPGLGHLYLGDRVRGVVLLATITLTFWTGIAVGGIRKTVDPRKQKLWFTAQLMTGGNSLSALAWHKAQEATPANPDQVREPSHWASVDVGMHYTGVAGLLNLLVILDAIGRADRSVVRKRRDAAAGKG